MSAAARPARSIRTPALAGGIGALLAVLGAAAWLSFAASEEEAQELFDARLATSARVLEALVARQVENATIAAPIVIALPGPLEAENHDTPSPLGHYYETKIAFQVRDGGGRLRALGLGAGSAVRAAGARVQHANPRPAPVARVLAAVRRRLGAGGGKGRRAQRARREARARRGGAAHRRHPAAAGAVQLLIRYGLAPLSSLARQVVARQPGSVAPIRLARTPAEAAPLVDALNGLLGRVREALERERRFTADAAHELRTPLAALKVHAQNAARAESAVDREASLERMLAGLERTVHLAEQMLAYSRAAAPGDAAGLEQVPLRALAAEAMDAVQPPARSAAWRCNWTARRRPWTSACAASAKLLSLLTNLVDNAVRYGPAGGRVDIALRRDGAGAVFSVPTRARASRRRCASACSRAITGCPARAAPGAAWASPSRRRSRRRMARASRWRTAPAVAARASRCALRPLGSPHFSRR